MASGCIWPPQSGHGGQGNICLAHGGGQRGANPISEGLEMLAMGMPLWGPRLLLGGTKANLHLLEPSCAHEVAMGTSPAPAIPQRVTKLSSAPQVATMGLQRGTPAGISTGARWGQGACHHLIGTATGSRDISPATPTPPFLPCATVAPQPLQQRQGWIFPSALQRGRATSAIPGRTSHPVQLLGGAAKKLPRNIGRGKRMSWPRIKPAQWASACFPWPSLLILILQGPGHHECLPITCLPLQHPQIQKDVLVASNWSPTKRLGSSRQEHPAEGEQLLRARAEQGWRSAPSHGETLPGPVPTPLRCPQPGEAPGGAAGAWLALGTPSPRHPAVCPGWDVLGALGGKEHGNGIKSIKMPQPKPMACLSRDAPAAPSP